MKKSIIFCLAILIFGIASVVFINKGFTLRANQKQINIVPSQYKGTHGTLAYEINWGKNEFGIDEEIIVGTKMTNIGSETIMYISSGRGPSCDNDISIKIINEKSKKEYFLNEKVICTMDVRSSKLDPGQTVESKWKFTPPMPVESGVYELMVYLPKVNIINANSINSTDIPGYEGVNGDGEMILAKKIPINVK